MGGGDGFGIQPVLLEQDDDIAFLLISCWYQVLHEFIIHHPRLLPLQSIHAVILVLTFSLASNEQTASVMRIYPTCIST